MSNRLEDLEIYTLSEEFAFEIWSIVITWDYFAKDTVGKQLVRSADSISANIAEGFGRFHYKENKNFCYFSRGSLIETKTWIKKAQTRELINEDKYSFLLQKLESIHIKLNAYIKFDKYSFLLQKLESIHIKLNAYIKFIGKNIPND